MKKKSIIAMMMALGLAGSMALPTQAAGVQCIGGKTQLKGCVIVNGEACNLPEIKSSLEEWCEQLQNADWKECPVISFPNCNQPENGLTPEDSENNQPEEEKPEQDNSNTTPDAEQPGGSENQPEVDVPGNDETENQPEIDNEELSYAQQVVNLVNAERAKAGLSALELDTELASAALIRANEITALFSHTRPDGRSFSTVLTDNGIRYNGAGENIAWGQKSPEQVMEAWMNSDGHRANILNAKFTKIGVGHYQNASGTNYWAQLFTY